MQPAAAAAATWQAVWSAAAACHAGAASACCCACLSHAAALELSRCWLTARLCCAGSSASARQAPRRRACPSAPGLLGRAGAARPLRRSRASTGRPPLSKVCARRLGTPHCTGLRGLVQAESLALVVAVPPPPLTSTGAAAVLYPACNSPSAAYPTAAALMPGTAPTTSKTERAKSA